MNMYFSGATPNEIKRKRKYSNDEDSNETSDESDGIENDRNDNDDDLTGTSVRAL